MLLGALVWASLAGSTDAKALARPRPLPLKAATLSTLPRTVGGVAEEPWRWEMRTDDGLQLNESDLRDKRSNWLRDLLSIGNSRVLQRVADRLFGTTLWAAFVAASYQAEDLLPAESSFRDAMEMLLVPTWPHEAVGGFLAILLVFRTDQAYERFWEGRALWASVHSATRSLCMLAMSHFGPGPTRDMLLAYATAFPIALREHLRGRRDIAEIERVFAAYSGPHGGGSCSAGSSALALLRAADNMPSTLLTGLSVELGFLLRSNQLDIPDAPADASGQRQAALWALMQQHVERLTEVIGSCERLKLTPIPLSYSRHTSRFFTLYLLTLPFTLVKECNPLTVPAICIGIGYVLYAMEEIGHVIEEPFSLAFGPTAKGDAGGATDSPQVVIAGAGTSLFLGIVNGFYMTLAMVLGYKGGLNDPEVDRGVIPLEVLPLRKYCAIIELEIANLAALAVERELRQPRAVAPVGLHGTLKGLWASCGRAAPAAPGEDDDVPLTDADRYHLIAANAVEKLKLLNDGPGRASTVS
jgi:predicted membrane chloride channel (bestrophin family)